MPPYQYIVGDIGGTNSRMVLYESTHLLDLLDYRTVLRRDYKSRRYDSLSEIVVDFIAFIRAESKAGPNNRDEQSPAYLQVAVFCVAGPVSDDQTSQLTNLPWGLSGAALQEATGIKLVHLQNDFKSIGYGTLAIQEQHLVCVNRGVVRRNKVIGVLGAGTGLGQCFVTFDTEGQRYVHSSEGGHSNFSPQNAEEFGLLEFTRSRLDVKHVSTERLLSGSGLFVIYEYLSSLFKYKKIPRDEVKAAFEACPESKEKLVTQHGFGPARDLVCWESVKLFLRLYGSEASNLAVKIHPKRGLYLAGGMIVRILEMCEGSEKEELLSEFKNNFFDKGRMNKLLKDIPIYIITNEDVGLIGAVYVAKKYLRKQLEGSK